jgi:hypothetical protein
MLQAALSALCTPTAGAKALRAFSVFSMRCDDTNIWLYCWSALYIHSSCRQEVFVLG